jgi:hypothetical protein
VGNQPLPSPHILLTAHLMVELLAVCLPLEMVAAEEISTS